MIHYHGGPITPASAALKAWTGRHAFISFAHPEQLPLAAEVCQSFALDNGAFSLWRGSDVPIEWAAYYAWVADWRRHPGFDFAVVPDVIEGSEGANDALAGEWPFPRHDGAVVWHTDESVDRLIRLATEWPRVCIGSSAEFDVKSPAAFLARAHEAISAIVDPDGFPTCKLHGLRMLNPAIFAHLPLASADSTNVARNIGIDEAWRGTYQPRSKEIRAVILVDRIEAVNGACRLSAAPPTVDPRDQLSFFLGAAE